MPQGIESEGNPRDEEWRLLIILLRAEPRSWRETGAVSICHVLKSYLKEITDNDSLEVYELRELTTGTGEY
jgi:hypothetical protein